ncbi:hypothetical protein HMPREF9098_0807 [Kingella denitrificans ATCC 33394]|uniref:Uncharacterized protein n=1 Tax=Kingella denitrificans ATCC 33394 TaxID=888741 RepID=F0EY73_9NEIS|nr:hypothetical protein HMPREF9098_0807 [Kingella denitrificans ATCC 33394]
MQSNSGASILARTIRFSRQGIENRKKAPNTPANGLKFIIFTIKT